MRLEIYLLLRFPGGHEEPNSPPSKKIYEELVPYHEAYDNAKNKY